MSLMTTKKLKKVEAPAEDKAEGIEAYQAVEFTINFGNSETVDVLDTKIMTDGRQIVIGGNGFIPHGHELTEY